MTQRHAVVIYNPAKITNADTFRTRVAGEFAKHDWAEPHWLTTTQDDPGTGMANTAIDMHPDLVLAAGGDGTVRAVSSRLAGSGLTFGLLPAGTGNLLARNLGIPLDETQALKVVFDGQPKAIDLVRIVVDGHEDQAEHFAVMAGVGFDAQMMSDTNQDLKKVVGSGAYVLAFAQGLGTEPHRMRIQIDDAPAMYRRAVLTVIGNVSSLQGGISLLPDARPDDALIDLVVAAPRGVTGWLRFVTALIAKLRRSNQIQYFQGRKIVISVLQPMPWELDGDTRGKGTHFEVTVAPKALQIMVPAR